MGYKQPQFCRQGNLIAPAVPQLYKSPEEGEPPPAQVLPVQAGQIARRL